MSAGVWLSACVNPQQVELLEREQRRLRGDMNYLALRCRWIPLDLWRIPAQIFSKCKESSARSGSASTKPRCRSDGRLGQTNRDGDQRVKNLEERLAKLEEDAKSPSRIVKSP